MKSLARLYVRWPGIDIQIEQVVRDCAGFQLNRQAPRVAPLHPWAWPTRPWEKINIDFAGPFLCSMSFIVIDAHSKWPEVITMKSATSERTIKLLRSLFSRFGIPEQVVSDNGPQFTSQEFKEFLQMNRVKHITSAPRLPSSNGEAERIVRTLKSALNAGSSM